MALIRSRKQVLQYFIAGKVAVVFIGTVIFYPDLAGVEGIVGYLFVGLLIVYLFALASDRIRHSRYYPFFQSLFFLSWGGYNLLRGRLGLLTVILLVGGVAALLWEGYQLSKRRASTA